MEADFSELGAAEAHRCALLMAADARGLEAILADSLVHVHLDGRVDDKAGYLRGFRNKYRFQNVVRGPLNIRVWADSAVMVGPLSQRLEVLDRGEVVQVEAITTQTWQRSDGRWLLTTCHNAPLTA